MVRTATTLRLKSSEGVVRRDGGQSTQHPVDQVFVIHVE